MLSLAHFLAGNGFEVAFIGPANLASKVQESGFRFYFLSPFLLTPEEVDIPGKGWFITFFENLTRSRYYTQKQVFENNSAAYGHFLNGVKPALVLLDDHFATKTVFYRSLNIPVVTVQTMFPPVKAIGIPPFQSDYIPTQTPLSLWWVECLWKINHCKRSWQLVKSWVMMRGQTNLSILRKLFPDSPLELDFDRSLGIGIKKVPMITMAPKAMDFFTGSYVPNGLFFGRQLKEKLEPIEDKRLIGRLERLAEERKNGSNKILIYCSLGTVTESRVTVCIRFFKEVLKVARQLGDSEFILSTSKGVDISALPVTPANVSVFETVPQRQLLQHADMMITHGGLNSIRECIEAEVPMLVYPLTRKWDQPGNAARVVYHGLGLRGVIHTATVDSIKEKIDFLREKRHNYLDALRSMKVKIEEVNKAEGRKILELVNGLVRKEPQSYFTSQ